MAAMPIHGKKNFTNLLSNQRIDWPEINMKHLVLEN